MFFSFLAKQEFRVRITRSYHLFISFTIALMLNIIKLYMVCCIILLYSLLLVAFHIFVLFTILPFTENAQWKAKSLKFWPVNCHDPLDQRTAGLAGHFWVCWSSYPSRPQPLLQNSLEPEKINTASWGSLVLLFIVWFFHSSQHYWWLKYHIYNYLTSKS